jgi:hypothetical protein
MNELDTAPVGVQFVFDNEDGSQVLVTVWGETDARIALRPEPFSSWSAPVFPTKVEKI